MQFVQVSLERQQGCAQLFMLFLWLEMEVGYAAWPQVGLFLLAVGNRDGIRYMAKLYAVSLWLKIGHT